LPETIWGFYTPGKPGAVLISFGWPSKWAKPSKPKNFGSSWPKRPPALAERQYQAALAVQPELLEVRDNLARLYYSVGRPADAETQFRKMIAQAPDRAEGYFSLAQLLAEDDSRLA
jgi:tetratricopeptide (TPR) repeat protein